MSRSEQEGEIQKLSKVDRTAYALLKYGGCAAIVGAGLGAMRVPYAKELMAAGLVGIGSGTGIGAVQKGKEVIFQRKKGKDNI